MKNNFNLSELIRPNVLNMKPYSSARDEYKASDSEMIFLDANENPFNNEVNRYPDPQQRELKAVLGDLKGIPTNQMLLGNGSDEVLDLIFRAFCEPNVDNIVTFPPTYGMYGVLASLNAIENREINLDENFQIDISKTISAIDKNTKLIFICSPNNPTGNTIEQEKVLKLLNDFSGVVVIDEAYIDFSSEESWIKKLKEFPNLIVTQTLSKAYGMAGIRLGICYSSEEIINTLNKIKPPYNVNVLTQEKAKNSLLDESKIQVSINTLLDERSVLSKQLLEVGYIQKIYPSEANFLLVKVDDALKRYNQILENGIVIRNRSSQPGCENTLRFTIGTPAENAALLSVLKKLK